MCGRYTLTKTKEALSQAFSVDPDIEIEAQYNIAPTQMVIALLCNQNSKEREFKRLRWGLIPSWAKDPTIGAKLINARSETVAEKPAFRAAFLRRRCLIVADGFYEWKKQSGKKQPFYFCLEDKQAFGFAGLWEQWESPEGEEIASCTILTTKPNELVESLHDRMPVILEKQDYNLWLDPQVQTPEPLQQILDPYPASSMIGYPVSTIVNNPKYNSPECIVQIS
ncbi:SOS response-associated peptidase [Aetokthonos hydrillicola Thurmond2011]|jgi:putative SOS response-associated peptidase YedK|uniref:Abasic site processing protein n=1 Tax=Aetokthonos hydrillicola Thurmond2011 TaxID=2712845 RepID=A0AAP5I8D1_9CYAN|nr:SOS response-associated peptidase [Aetokthonos hydrillicola]MBO3463634.1 SOS response-associated peptidase [Aetokthonos hydrillicola CCALA 1050]MBW4583675.1 SOS response-associated peptidase [Aetokthonos hydrillicola CCALA 1050]MDR9895629.1 SOS response-associated peptidase [Aetokthonos hydrillicola Thurmond2011]